MRKSVSLGVFLGSVVLSALGGCNKASSQAEKDSTTESDAASPTAEKSAKSDEPAGPCGELKSKLCEKVGNENALCSAAGQLLPVFADEACKTELSKLDQTFAKLEELRKDCGTLVKRLCAEVQPDTCKMVTETSARFPPEQCTGMLENFDRVLAELKGEEAKRKPVEGELLTALHAPDAPSFGPESAKVTVVEFSDFQCPYCSKAANVAHEIQKKYPQVRFVFRQFPLSFHKQAQKASEASLAAQTEGKFWEFHDQLFANQRELAPEALRTYAKNVGVSDAAMKDALEGQKYASRVAADIELGGKVGVGGTPSMFVNGKRVENPTDFGSVSQLIDEQLAATN